MIRKTTCSSYVFGFGLLILIAATVGAAVVLRQLIHMASSFMA